MTPLSVLKVKLFADGAELDVIRRLAADPLISGFTTNPSLMRKAGVFDYEAFARDVLDLVGTRPVSFEVCADDWSEMHVQALEIASWGQNVYVKIPITDTSGRSAASLLKELASSGVKVNVTAILTLDQVSTAAQALADGPAGIISVFAGRYADTGRDPVPLMAAAVGRLQSYPRLELLWASPRELLNVVQADAVGCDIVTLTSDLVTKLPLLGKDVGEYSLETVRMFFDDATKAAYRVGRSSARRA